MKTCACGHPIPRSIRIEGKARNLKNRTKCLSCLPFGQARQADRTRNTKRAHEARIAYRTYKEKHGVDKVRVRREAKKRSLIISLGGACQICGYDKIMRNLAFHHLSDKEMGLCTRGFQLSWDKILLEVEKCVLVCHNCHGEIHEGYIDILVIKELNKTIKFKVSEFRQQLLSESTTLS